MIIGILLTALIVPIVLNAMSGKTKTTSIDKFDMRLPKSQFLFLGLVCCVFFGLCLYGTISSGQADTAILLIFGSLFALGFLLMLCPIKGFWENSVDRDLVTSTRLWIIKKTIKISEIDHYVMKRGGISIYLKGQTKPTLGIDSMVENIPNFMKRMEKEGIPVEIKDVLNPQMFDTVNSDDDQQIDNSENPQSMDNNDNN